MRLNWLQLELLDLFLSWQTQQEQRKLACAMPNAARYCLSKKDDSYCCLFLFIHRIIFYMCKRHVLPQIAQITQRECSFAALFRRERLFGVSVVLGFVSVNLRDLRETLGFLGWLIEYSYVNILPQIALITQRNAASCIISQIKTGCSLFVYGKLCKFA